MKTSLICSFALHIASLLARQDGEHGQQHALGGGDNGRGDNLRAPLPAAQAQAQAQAPVLASAPLPESKSKSEPEPEPDKTISVPLFLSLERYARLVDIAYCVGITGSGISRPFSCVSRCADFPEVRLLSTWSTGILMHDSCGFIAVDDSAREIIVAFRGTYSIANTVADLSTIPQKYEPYDAGEGEGKCDDSCDPPRIKCTNCTVHSGFMDSWRSTRHIVLPVVTEARKHNTDNVASSSSSSSSSFSSSSLSSSSTAPYRVHLLGHSLGGAVAALAALEMKTVLGWEDVVVTTFGEPRVGNGNLATFLDHVFDLHNKNDTAAEGDGAGTSYRRVTHINDPVPLLPLTEWGYSSHAGEVFIRKLNLSPTPQDVILCHGRNDPDCSDEEGAPDDGDDRDDRDRDGNGNGNGNGNGKSKDYDDYDYGEWHRRKRTLARRGIIPSRLKLWELFYAHRDYFWRLGLCVPGSDPADWGREHYNFTEDEL
ncbi:MAG: hypothetical protein STHCBS139747_004600 [Sporothrix thermara]